MNSLFLRPFCDFREPFLMEGKFSEPKDIMVAENAEGQWNGSKKFLKTYF